MHTNSSCHRTWTHCRRSKNELIRFLNISYVYSEDGECSLEQAASSIIRSRRDDERQGFKLKNTICGF
jgi:hypothetical protein